MAIELKRPPSEVFFSPGLESGISYIEQPDWIVRPAPGARIELIAGSEFDAVNEDVERANERLMARIFDTTLEVRASPVVLEDAIFLNSYMTIDGRLVLNGAAGDRLRMQFDKKNPKKWRRDRLIEYFHRRRGKTDVTDPETAPPTRHQPIALELKNGFNFYHFLTETLGSLAFFLNDDSDEPIMLHHSGSDIRPFIPAFIEAIFPELAHRIRFTDKRGKYGRVRSVFNHRHYLYQVNDFNVSDALAAEGIDRRWRKIRPDVQSFKGVKMNSFDTSQRLLRETALSRLDPDVVARLPRRIYVDRAEGGKDARARGVEGDGPLIAALEARGFERVYFEKMTPLMQIASMQAADIMISPHGAGLANMIFARPDTLAVEIGTRQTQLHRWGDFLPLAHVAACRYATVFADVNVDDPTEVPSMTEGHVGIRIGPRAIKEIVSLVDGYAPPSSKSRSA